MSVREYLYMIIFTDERGRRVLTDYMHICPDNEQLIRLAEHIMRKTGRNIKKIYVYGKVREIEV